MMPADDDCLGVISRIRENLPDEFLEVLVLKVDLEDPLRLFSRRNVRSRKICPLLQAMTDDAAPASLAFGCHGLDGALDGAEIVELLDFGGGVGARSLLLEGVEDLDGGGAGEGCPTPPIRRYPFHSGTKCGRLWRTRSAQACQRPLRRGSA